MSRPRAAIFGCAGPDLTPDERVFFRDVDPLGFILFARNVDTPERTRRLVEDLRSAVARADAPVLTTSRRPRRSPPAATLAQGPASPSAG
jgi:beta-N-acetylhexosaminidase